jgi:signal transduction histidine kinase
VLAYSAALLLITLTLLAPPLGLAEPVPVTAGFFFSVALGIVCIASLAREYRARRGDPVRDRATVMLLGATVSFLPLLALLLLQYFFGTPFPWRFTLLGLAVFPAAVGWAIARNQLFDVRAAARSSAAYGAVTLGITGVFALLVTSADALFERFNVNARSPLFSIAFLFLAILLFTPLRSRVQRFVDSSFDRDRAAYRRAVREISEAMVSMLSVGEIADRILVAVTDTMGVEGALVLLPDPAGESYRVEAARGDWDEEARDLQLSARHPICRRLWMRREDLARSDFDEERDPEVREEARDVFDTLGAELLVPVLYGVDLLGLIAVGRKLSGERLGGDDRQLLRTLANQSAIAIENARAFDEIAKLNENLESRVDERTLELRQTQAQLLQSEKMRSLGQLVAGVAHELNNPIGFVHANLQLIDEYVGRLERSGIDEEERVRVRAALRKLVTRSREGTSRVKQIVQDLRSFSRADTAQLQEVDLNDEIDRTLSLMESRLGHGIDVERSYGRLPRVRCFAGQLNQVFMNLLINACDALDGKGTIGIRTAATPSGVRLEFSDDGPGIPPEAQGRIFEPFFTTKPVGQGTGLGLSLSHGIVENHGGSLSVRSAPGAGATFTVELPLQPPSDPAAEPEGP